MKVLGIFLALSFMVSAWAQMEPPYSSLSYRFYRGEKPSTKDFKGFYSGRCFAALKPTIPLPAHLIVGELKSRYRGPWFEQPKVYLRFVVVGEKDRYGNYYKADLYDKLPKRFIKRKLRIFLEDVHEGDLSPAVERESEWAWSTGDWGGRYPLNLWRQFQVRTLENKLVLLARKSKDPNVNEGRYACYFFLRRELKKPEPQPQPPKNDDTPKS
jgi:hypothetical protein